MQRVFLTTRVSGKGPEGLLRGTRTRSSDVRQPLTVDVAMEGHHARPLRTPEGRVMKLIRQRGRDPGLGVSLGSPAVLRGVFFVSCSAVLKPDL